MARMSERGRLWAKRGLRVAAVATGIFGGLYMLAQFALAKFNDMQAVSYTHLTLPTNREV